MHPFEHLNKVIKQVLKTNLRDGCPIELSEVPDPKLGDLAFPCFRIVNSYKFTTNIYKSKKRRSVTEVAKELATQIKPDKYIEKVEAVGPYLNFFLRKERIFKEICRLPLAANFEVMKAKKIILEFSQPNTNKPLHLGHLRNTILGNSIANLLKAVGNKVIKVNLINNRGIHICKSTLMYQKKLKVKSQKLKIKKDKKGDHLVGEYYSLFNREVQKNPKLLEEAQEMLRKWEAGDKKILALGKKMNKWALDGFKETYKRLDIKFDKWYFESKIYKKGRKIILDALKKGRCYRRKDGAVEIDLGCHESTFLPSLLASPGSPTLRLASPKTSVPGLGKKVLLRSDGTSVYVTQDIALAKLKFDQYKPDKSIYLTGHEQEYHFKVLFKILERFGFPWVKKCKHLWHGMVFLPEGKMKSREGKVVEADELMDEMKELAKNEILERNKFQIPNSKFKIQNSKNKEKELETRSEKIAQTALKFYLLNFSPEQEINFKPEESLSFEGATGIYVMYAYVRIQSILRNSKFQIPNFKSQIPNLGNPEEWEIGKLLLWFPQIIQKTALNYNPGNLAEHLLKIAGAFNKFYEKHSVLFAETSELTKARLVLIAAIAQALKKGMELLGIKVVDRM
jgi:arginyl-tRNA synthetase